MLLLSPLTSAYNWCIMMFFLFISFYNYPAVITKHDCGLYSSETSYFSRKRTVSV